MITCCFLPFAVPVIGGDDDLSAELLPKSLGFV
jgi:hypothetical protein